MLTVLTFLQIFRKNWNGFFKESETDAKRFKHLPFKGFYLRDV